MICISALGYISAKCFTQSRGGHYVALLSVNDVDTEETNDAVIQELGREGVLPYSRAFASNAPYNTPFTALILQWAMCTFWIFTPPPGTHTTLSLISTAIHMIG